MAAKAAPSMPCQVLGSRLRLTSPFCRLIVAFLGSFGQIENAFGAF